MPFDLHPIDLLLLLLLLLAGLGGWRRGLAMVVLGYAGLLAGLAVGAWVAVRVGVRLVEDLGLARAGRRGGVLPGDGCRLHVGQPARPPRPVAGGQEPGAEDGQAVGAGGFLDRASQPVIVRHQHPVLALAPHAVVRDRDGEEEQQGGGVLDGDPERDLL